jgi:hypothetical protein
MPVLLRLVWAMWDLPQLWYLLSSSAQSGGLWHVGQPVLAEESSVPCIALQRHCSVVWYWLWECTCIINDNRSGSVHALAPTLTDLCVVSVLVLDRSVTGDIDIKSESDAFLSVEQSSSANRHCSVHVFGFCGVTVFDP